MDNFIKTHESLTQAMCRLEIQLSQQTNPLSEKSKETLPSQSLPNPRNFRQTSEAQDQQPNQCNVVHIFQLEKQVDNQVSTPPNPIQNNPTKASISSSFTQSKSDESEKGKSGDQVHKPIVSFSNRLKNNKQMHTWIKYLKCLIYQKLMCHFLMLSNKSHHMQNFLRTYAPRRERQMHPRKSSQPLTLVSYCRV